MWLRRKQKNRRLGREHVLDVKLRSSQVRAARSRLAVLSLLAVFVAGAGVYVLWRGGELALDELVYANRAFALEEIDLQTDGVIAVDQLRHWTGISPGQNLLALDLARVKRDLELMPMVQAASIERILPHTLRVRVFEREPIAQVTALRPKAAGGIETAVFLLDSEGYVMLPLDPRQRSVPPSADEQLPGIVGVAANELQPGRRIEAPPVQTALQLLAAFDRSSMASQVEVTRVDVSAPEILQVTTAQGSAITFGLADLDQQLRRWHEIFDWGRKAGKVVATLDLAVTNNVPANWLEASSVPPSFPKAPKLLRTKRKHV
jgi:cell division septal protein FtsQ